MYLISIRFIGSFPDGEKVVEVSSPNGGGGSTFHLSVNNLYLGIIHKPMNKWRVSFQNPNDDYSGGDLQPLIDLIVGEN